MKNTWNLQLCTAICSLMLISSEVGAVETKAKNLILMDYDTGQYLFEKDADKMIPPASMSKLMTVYIVFSKLKDGSLSLDDTFTVSENAWRKGGAASGGSTMFLSIGDKVRVEDLLKGIIIQSGNDACIVVAENLSGNEESFAQEMNEKALELGMNNSHFENATGLPHPDHRMSVEDLAKLARHLIADFPQYYHLFSQKEFVYHNIRQGNRNPLLYSMPYADGLKTGHTEEAGFCLTASAKKGDRRLIGVMTGLNSNKERSDEANKIMSWGFREFDNYTILKKGQKIADMPVWYGVNEKVDMVVAEDVVKTLKKNKYKNVKTVAIYDKPVKAPVKAGDKLGVIKVKIEGQDDMEFPLIAASNVKKVGLLGKIRKNLNYLISGAN
ncbi:MAG: D-alanyl-D-alanine carboxypeptidase [Alphaproteobacteria bacterium]|nr:D-alanyl-D-alanine carboxypeptidase [Alphaproteobacteria bacterium]